MDARERVKELAISTNDSLPSNRKDIEATQFLEKIKAALLSPDEEIIEVVALGIDKTPAFTFGNFSCISGAAKSRKTFLATALILAYILGEFLDSKLFRGDSTKNKVIQFDTEQGRSKGVDHLRIKHSVSPLVAEHLQVYSLRPYNYKERLHMVETVIYGTKDLGLVVIDGIRDLIADINNIEESCMLVEKLMKWSQELDIHIICVLHTNKRDNSVRGHIGTEVINKAETTIEVVKDSKEKFVSVVKPKYTRGEEFEEFAFGVNDKKLPTLAEGFGKTESIKPENIPIETHTQVVTSIFNRHKDLSANKLEGYLQAAYDEQGVSIGLVKAREFKDYLILKKMIANTNDESRNGSSHKYNKI